MIEIAPANQIDLQEIEKLLGTNDLPASDLGPHVEFMVLRDKGKLQAIAGVEQYTPSALLRSIVVPQKYRSSGLGRRIVILMIDYLTIKGISDIYLLTTTVPKFFEKLGFTEIPRTSVPEIISQTKEFSEICPDSATCMHYSTF